MNYCKRCLLPEHKPDIVLDKDGICNICSEYDKDDSRKTEKPLLETDLLKVLNKYRGKGQYDCMVMCSGGKDSTMALYLMKKRFKMNPLAFTFDHGFENDEALENVKNATDILDVDWIYHKTNYMRDAFKMIIDTCSTAPICHICAIWYIRLVFDFSNKLGIPLLVAGWTKGQSTQGRESGQEYISMSKATDEFIKKHMRKIPKYKDFPTSTLEVLKKAQKKYKAVMVSPYWYMDWDSEKIRSILTEELNWKAPAQSYPANSTNCLMNFPSTYLALKNFGYSHYHIEMSKQVRVGEISREEAENTLKLNFGLDDVNEVLGKIGTKIDQ